MSDVVIRAEGLGKKYIIGRSMKALGRSAVDMICGRQIVAGDETEDFWALKDVNFEIKNGDVVGIIGRNGAGKSTLLKILSRITEPSTGRVEIKGRVASLLEVGTGFHPELLGRENIYLNGAILGMSREEIPRKLDEIVDFAGVEKFLDTPVKRYSSGMYVRLTFAVAAHLESEILIIDEVLAVGDTEFQKKCLGKMQDFAGQGRTVLFVIHNMAAVRRLCNNAIVLRAGSLVFQGSVERAMSDYIRNNSDAGKPVPVGNKWLEIQRVEVQQQGQCHAGPSVAIDSHAEFLLTLKVAQFTSIPVTRYVVSFKTPDDITAFCITDHRLRELELCEKVLHTLELKIPAKLLNSGQYSVLLRCGHPGAQVLLQDFQLMDLDIAPIDRSGTIFPETWPGAVLPDVEVSVQHQRAT